MREGRKIMKKFILAITILFLILSINVSADSIQTASLPSNATEEQLEVTENLVGGIFAEVQNGLGYAEARAKSNNIIFNAWLKKQTNGYSYSELTSIANNLIWTYRDMFLRPQFYAENEEKVKCIISEVIDDYKNGIIDYPQACKNARNKIYQSVNSAFDYNTEYAKDNCYRDVPAVDSRLFIIARKLIAEAK